MATAQNLVVNILGNASQLSRSAKQAQASVQQLEMRVTASVGSIVRQFAGLAGITGLSYLAQQSYRSIDATAKLADELGLATQTLQGYSHAAGLTGTNNETVTKGLQRLSRRLGEARAGYGQGVKGLELLGLTARDVGGTLDQSFEAVAEQISKIKDPAQQAAAAYALFGRQGQQMLGFLKQGKAGIREMSAEAERLGITFTRVEAAKIEQANDAFLRLRQAALGAAQTIAIELAPILTQVAGTVTDGVRRFKEWGKQAIAVGVAIGTVTTSLYAVRAAKQAVVKAQVLLQAVSGPKGWAMLAAGVLVYAGTMRVLEASTTDNVQSRRQHAAALGEEGAAAQQAAAAIAGLDRATRSSAASIDDHLRSAAQARSELDQLKAVQVDRWFDDEGHAEKLADATRRIGEHTRAARAEALKFTDQFKSGAQKIREELEQLETAVRGGGMAAGDPAEGAGRAIVDKHTGVFTEIKTLRDELARLRGESTETEQKLRDMLAAGAPQEEVDRLRTLHAQRDALKEQAEQQEAWNKKLAEGQEHLDQLAETLKDSLKTDQDRLREEQERIKLLHLSGRLTKEQAQQLVAQARQKLLDKEQQSKPKRPADSGPNTILEARSREGIEAFNKLFRPGGSESQKPEEQQVALLAKIEQSQSRQLALQQKQGRPIQLGGR